MIFCHEEEKVMLIDAQEELDLHIAQALLLKLMAFRGARALQVAAQLGIPDLLREGSRSVEELALATHTHAFSLYRLLRTVAAQGIIDEVSHQVFAQNTWSAYLCSDHPSCLHYQALMLGADYDIAVTQRQDYSIRTGKPALQFLYKTDMWEYLTDHGEEYFVFNKAMTALSLLDTLPILQQYDFSAFHTLVDVGGGHGTFLFNLLKRYPALQGTLFDRPSVISEAQVLSQEAECRGRCMLVAGDMFTEIPAGADAYFLKHILHDWGDEQCCTLLRTCHRAMLPSSTLLISEVVMPPTGAHLLDTLFDLSMLVKLGEGAHERTAEEFQQILTRAGFHLQRIIKTAGQHSIIEAVRLETNCTRMPV
jgi:hypothetical protein